MLEQLNWTMKIKTSWKTQTSQLDVYSSFSFSCISEIGEKLVIVDEEPENMIKIYSAKSKYLIEEQEHIPRKYPKP